MIIHRGETTDSHRETTGKLLEPILDPLLTVMFVITQQIGASHAASNAVVPARQRRINQMCASDCHDEISLIEVRTLCTSFQYSRQGCVANSSPIISISTAQNPSPPNSIELNRALFCMSFALCPLPSSLHERPSQDAAAFVRRSCTWICRWQLACNNSKLSAVSGPPRLRQMRWWICTSSSAIRSG
jgi:hypothetical protein